MCSELATSLAKSLESQREHLLLAYNALNDELIKVQIEGSVIGNIQKGLVVRSSYLARHSQT